MNLSVTLLLLNRQGGCASTHPSLLKLCYSRLFLLLHQGKQKRNNRKVKDKGRYEKPDIAVEDEPEHGRNDFLAQEAEPVGETRPLEDVSDVSDSMDCPPKPLQADSEDRDSSTVNWDTDTSELHLTTEANGIGICGISFIQNGQRKSPSVMDDSSSTCSTDSLPSVIANGPCKVTSLLKQNNPKSPSRLQMSLFCCCDECGWKPRTSLNFVLYLFQRNRSEG